MKPTHVSAKRGDVVVLIGTSKGAFIARANAKRKKWEVGGPYFPGVPIHAVAFDGRNGRNRIWASTENPFYGSNLHSSDDFGETWSEPKQALVKFPKASGKTLVRIWQLQPGVDGELYAGVEPAALFISRDDGKSFSLVEGLSDHPHSAQWQPGGGGLCLHTIVPNHSDKKKLLIAISTGGVYITDDGGKTWKDIANGVPSDFGFPIAVHPHDPDTAYCIPLEPQMRVMPDGRAAVWRTTNAGKKWKPLTKGLPKKNALETVLRDGLCTDVLDPAGIYFGTRSGKVYASNNDGEKWSLVRDGLPAVLCVKAAQVGANGKARKEKEQAKAKEKNKAKSA